MRVQRAGWLLLALVVLAGIGRAIIMEENLGVTAGHAEAIAFVEQWLDKLVPPRHDGAGQDVQEAGANAR